MRFLIDADLPRDASALLASFQHDPIDVRDIGMRYSEDSDIALFAQQQKLCILSGDWGFSDIRIYPPEQYSGIVITVCPLMQPGPLFCPPFVDCLRDPIWSRCCPVGWR